MEHGLGELTRGEYVYWENTVSMITGVGARLEKRKNKERNWGKRERGCGSLQDTGNG